MSWQKAGIERISVYRSLFSFFVFVIFRFNSPSFLLSYFPPISLFQYFVMSIFSSFFCPSFCPSFLLCSRRGFLFLFLFFASFVFLSHNTCLIFFFPSSFSSCPPNGRVSSLLVTFFSLTARPFVVGRMDDQARPIEMLLDAHEGRESTPGGKESDDSDPGAFGETRRRYIGLGWTVPCCAVLCCCSARYSGSTWYLLSILVVLVVFICYPVLIYYLFLVTWYSFIDTCSTWYDICSSCFFVFFAFSLLWSSCFFLCFCTRAYSPRAVKSGAGR